MTPPPQHHRCSWARRRLTEITLSDGALIGAGAGISTFLFALAESERTWYAVEVDSDNAVYLTLSDDADDRGVELTHPLLPAALCEQLKVTEKSLSEASLEELAIDLEPGRALVGRPELTRHLIELHDDCFFRFESRDSIGIEKVLGGILALHGGYLDQGEVDTVAPYLLELLSCVGTLRLKSDPALVKVKLLGRARTGVARWLRPWKTIGVIEQTDSGWRVLRRRARS